MGDHEEPFAIGLPNSGVVCLAQARRGLYERIEHGLQIKGRTADDFQHIGGGRLLVGGFAEVVGEGRIFDWKDPPTWGILGQVYLFFWVWLDFLLLNTSLPSH